MRFKPHLLNLFRGWTVTPLIKGVWVVRAGRNRVNMRSESGPGRGVQEGVGSSGVGPAGGFPVAPPACQLVRQTASLNPPHAQLRIIESRLQFRTSESPLVPLCQKFRVAYVCRTKFARFFFFELRSFPRRMLRSLPQKSRKSKRGLGPNFRGNFCSSPMAVRRGRIGPEKTTGPGKAPISPEKARFSRTRFSLKNWGLSPVCEPPFRFPPKIFEHRFCGSEKHPEKFGGSFFTYSWSFFADS